MKTRLSPQDFTIQHIDDYKVKYFEWSGQGMEITIEPRMLGGYQVSVFDHNGILTRDRVNVDRQPAETPLACFNRAVDQANKFLSEPRLVIA